METLCNIRDLYRLIIAFEEDFSKEHNLSLNEGMLLCSLSKKERLTSGEIAELLGLTCSNTSKVIRSVEDKKLIRRQPGNTDKRQMYFSLTTKGYQVLEKVKENQVPVSDRLACVLAVMQEEYIK